MYFYIDNINHHHILFLLFQEGKNSLFYSVQFSALRNNKNSRKCYWNFMATEHNWMVNGLNFYDYQLTYNRIFHWESVWTESYILILVFSVLLELSRWWDFDTAEVDVSFLCGSWVTLKRPLRAMAFSSRFSIPHFFLSRFHTLFLQTKMMKMKIPVEMLMMSVGIQIHSAVKSPAAKEMISIIHETPIKMNKLNMTRNLIKVRIKW